MLLTKVQVSSERVKNKTFKKREKFNLIKHLSLIIL